VREWIERQVREREDRQAAPTPTSTPVMPNMQAEARIFQGMQKQLRDRDRQITDLRAQLEALKLIDQDHEQHRKVRPPASLKKTEYSQ
jgi:hypothetical protein